MTVGVVVGTFDMFHIGHLKLLLNAIQNCDFLIAGVNTDAVVLRDKNKKTIIPESDRLEIVNSIFCVSEAHLVTDNAVQFISDLLSQGKKIDFYFRGNEPEKPHIMVENKKITDMGVTVVQFPYTKSISSSKIRERLNNEKR